MKSQPTDEQVMWTRDHIRDALAALGMFAGELSASDVDAQFGALAERFARPGRSPLWDRLINSRGIDGSAVWRTLGDFLPHGGLLLVNDSQGSCGFRFNEGAAIVKVLEECPPFEFYITDDRQSFLLCLNHHDVLIAAGGALPWIVAEEAKT